MEIKSKILLSLFAVLIFLSIGISFYRFFILRDYTVQAQIACDPYTENCTVYHCNVDVETCTGDAEKDTSYYKILSRNAKNIPLCNQDDDVCGSMTCPSGEEGCAITSCEEGSECSDPVEYSQNHPVIDDVTNDSEIQNPEIQLDEQAQ